MKKRWAILSCMILAACVIAGGLLLYEEWEARQPPPILFNGKGIMNNGECRPEDDSDTKPIVSSIPDDIEETSVPENMDHSYTTDSNGFGTVTIHGNVFSVKRGVSQQALAENIGWMESSALPGSGGMCVLMGHRNQQFRILKDVQAGDYITFTYPDGSTYSYTVQSGKMVESDDALRFEATEGKTLTLVTCFPFYFRGSAPQKFIVYAKAD